MGNTCASRDKPTDPSLSPVNSSLPYEENRLRYGQYKAEYVSDQTPLAMLTRFEAKLPLVKIDIDEFERRLKKLANEQTGDYLSETQIVESFKDSLALKDITVAGSVVRQVLLDDTLKDKKKKGFLIPNILLLANMYCPSNPGLRAQKFFELCQENLDPQISANDKELKQLFMKMLEYSYVFIIRVYKANMVQGQDATIDNAWIPDEDKLEEIYDQMYEEFQDAVFKSKSKDSREEFLEELKEGNKCWLQPHFLRQQIFAKLTGSGKSPTSK